MVDWECALPMGDLDDPPSVDLINYSKNYIWVFYEEMVCCIDRITGKIKFTRDIGEIFIKKVRRINDTIFVVTNMDGGCYAIPKCGIYVKLPLKRS